MHDGNKCLRLKGIVTVMQNESEQFKQYKKHKDSERHNTMAVQLYFVSISHIMVQNIMVA